MFFMYLLTNRSTITFFLLSISFDVSYTIIKLLRVSVRFDLLHTKSYKSMHKFYTKLFPLLFVFWF